MHERHLDEAAFCFELRDAALEAPHYTLAEIEVGPERRLFNHLEALRRGGPLVAQHLLELASDPNHEIEQVAVAALGVMAAGPGVQSLLPRVREAGSADQRKGLAHALALGVDATMNSALVAELSRLLEHEPAQPTLLRALASHSGPNHALVGQLGDLLSSPNPEVVWAATQLARRGVSPTILATLAAVTQIVQQATEHPNDLRRATLECALIHSLPGAGDWVRHWAQQIEATAMRDHALTWLAQLGGPSEHTWLVWHANNTEPSRALLWALGFSGRVEAVDRCLDCLDDPALAPLAAEAICAITGLSTEDERYWLPPSDAAHDDGLPALEHDDLEADLVPDSEDALPRPDPAALRDWWARTRTQFSPELRYLAGRPLDGPGLLAALEHGSARRRSALAFELEVRSHGRAFVDTRAWCWAQRASLAAATAHAAGIDAQKGRL
ncbi:hypothetical protein G6O69_12075 [Pseudenhygromyxa sp. WMMC2535]|uniref:hypothetical protein n=1 Tax=Pseudenhygromyxa sp. WMMC2535 TaxID=2712867 RepID=UPI001595354A|nr:hypothetical protein [Pseudenhygromyxa sp. WMMC2535]NVB38570.1 hypothetical protein [Pseudenhygromyxa sp. WMMC2535]